MVEAITCDAAPAAESVSIRGAACRGRYSHGNDPSRRGSERAEVGKKKPSVSDPTFRVATADSSRDLFTTGSLGQPQLPSATFTTERPRGNEWTIDRASQSRLERRRNVKNAVIHPLP